MPKISLKFSIFSFDLKLNEDTSVLCYYVLMCLIISFGKFSLLSEI